jgi:Transglycosylase SLT domain
MRPGHRLLPTLIAMVICGAAVATRADPTAQTTTGLPPQVIPSAPEVGVTIMQFPGSSNTSGDGSTSTGIGPTGGSTSVGSGSAYDVMMGTSYGSQAANGAAAAGISADALAAIGQAESGFQNVATANGSSSATGPWQITTGTFMQYSNQYNLGYTPADMTNSADNAQVASYVIASYANTVSQATQAPATVLQTYGAYIFGPSAGSNIATAEDSAPLSQFVSGQALANNNMTGWTVGQFRAVMTSRLGPAANEGVTA